MVTERQCQVWFINTIEEIDAVAYPPNMSQKRRPLSLLLRRGAVCPNNVPETKEGVRARHGLRTPCQRGMIEFEASWGTWKRLPRACFTCIYLLLASKTGGYTPRCHFPFLSYPLLGVSIE